MIKQIDSKRKQPRKNQDKGFTLVELSIVLVIIGLIVGGVVGGQSLIKTARHNKVVTEIAQYGTALRTFDLQYDAKPGDFAEAFDYWGTDCAATDVLCNGNGDNEIGNIVNYIPQLEGVRAWQHLALAGLLPGSYNGRLSLSSGQIAASESELRNNLPSSATGGVYNIGSFTTGKDTWLHLSGPHDVGSSNFIHGGKLFSPVDAYKIDKKIDDGVSNTGKIVALIAHYGGSTYALPCYDTSNNNKYYISGEYDQYRGCTLAFSFDKKHQ
jgi:prepilin-type N-terminal cleavage/methylation domain-containing protein